MAENRTERALERYRAKRDFRKTAEPPGGRVAPGTSVFVVQKHAARRLHYDLRLQFGDTLKSWAVPQGPSLDPKVRRLAVHTEDHPLEYADFEEPIPKGQYGGGAMIVWDRGSWIPMGDAEADYRKGTLKFRLSGEKLGGGWMLVRLKPKEGERGDNWLLIKERDPYARPGQGDQLLEERPESVLSGREVEELLDDEAPSAPASAPRTTRRVRPSALPGALKAPLPEQVRPQLATPSARVPEGEEWLHEIKLDGYRTLARLEAGAVRLLTRTGQDWTERYGLLAKAFAALPCRQALVDGEIVVQDDNGIASFAALQDALAEGRTHELVCFAFDLLHLDGYDLTKVPLLERKRALAALLGPVVSPTTALQISEHVRGNGRAFFEQAARLGLEGVISKRADSSYQQARTRSWLKIKCRLSEEFTIVGYNPSEAAGGIGALLLADSVDGGLRYVGRVGTGFSMGEMKRLHARLDALRTRPAPVVLPAGEKRKGILWVRPALIAEVEYGNRTADGILRHAVYKGLRADKLEDEGAAQVAKAPPKVEKKRYVTDADLAQIWVTNPDRVMFGAGGPTKLELALYYAQVGDWMLPELIRRPVSLVRCPLGRIKDCFFQRHARPGMPEAVKTIALDRAGQRRESGLPLRRGCARAARARPVRHDRVPQLGLPGRPARAARPPGLRPRPGREPALARGRERRLRGPGRAGGAGPRAVPQDHRRQGPAPGRADPAPAELGRGGGVLRGLRAADGSTRTPPLHRQHGEGPAPRPGLPRLSAQSAQRHGGRRLLAPGTPGGARLDAARVGRASSARRPGRSELR